MGSGQRESYVSSWIKWLMFAFNMIFWVIGILLILVGTWAYIETKNFNSQMYTAETSFNVFDLLFDFTLILIAVGVLVVILTSFGAIGALRENICLLKTFAAFLIIIFLLEAITVIIVFAFSGKAKAGLKEILGEEAVKNYRDTDINRMNIIDWFQETFECCGVGEKGYMSWEMNKYFNCSSPGFEACSVPHSCCRPEYQKRKDYDIIDTRCGAALLDKPRSVAIEKIYVNGCVEAVLQNGQDNIFTIGGVGIAIVLPQLIGIALAKILWGQITDQKQAYATMY